MKKYGPGNCVRSHLATSQYWLGAKPIQIKDKKASSVNIGAKPLQIKDKKSSSVNIGLERCRTPWRPTSTLRKAWARRTQSQGRLGAALCWIAPEKTRPNSWAKQVREIERGHLILDFMNYMMKNGEGKVGRFLKKENFAHFAFYAYFSHFA